MDIEELRDHCLRKNGVTESFPFGNQTLVFKVGGKIFLLASLDTSPLQFNVKCDPGKAIELRENYSCVLPGYHMNKRHWNTVVCDSTTSKQNIVEWVDDSYRLVSRTLPKKTKIRISYDGSQRGKGADQL